MTSEPTLFTTPPVPSRIDTTPIAPVEPPMRPIQANSQGAPASATATDSQAAVGVDSDSPLLLTELQAAKVLSVCPRTLWTLRTEGRIPHIRIGRAVRYARGDLVAWIQNSRSAVSSGTTS